MKSYLKLLVGSLFVFTIIVACNKEESALPESADLTLEVQDTNRYIYYSPWEYVMDWRFSRAECASGPGICFRSEYGDIWDYGLSQGDPNIYVEEVRFRMNQLMEGNTDPDNGLIVFRMEGEVLHMVFSRDLEESNLVIDRDEQLGADISAKLGAAGITIPEGVYEVDRSNFEYGEVRISLK
ncbi:MAG: hypothetical protein AAF489_00885 [Bacteroidota bacterium]